MLQQQELQYTDDHVSSYLWKMHINGGLSIIFTGIAVYLILFKSPQTMGIYKWFLLNISVCILWFELFIIHIYIPFSIFPIPGFCAIGPIQHFGSYWGATMSFFLLCQFLGFCGMSVNYAAIFRLSAIYGVSGKITKPFYVIIFFFGQLFYSTPTLISGLLAVDDIDGTLSNMIKMYPDIREFIQTHTCFAIKFDNNSRLYACIAIALFQLVFCQGISSVVLLLSFRVLIKRRKIISKKLYNMHMQFILSLTVQSAVPFIVINIPFLLYGIFLITQSSAGIQFSQYMFVFVTSHSYFNTIIMVSLTKPYRQEILKLFCKNVKRKQSILVTTVSIKSIK